MPKSIFGAIAWEGTVKYIDRVVDKIEIGIRLLNRLTWLCFLVFVDMKIG